MSTRHNENVPTPLEAVKTSRVQGIGRITGKALALSIIAEAVDGVIKLVDLVTTKRRLAYSHSPAALRACFCDA
jgi:hypothetical protein